MKRYFIPLFACLLLGANVLAQINPDQGVRADWMRGSWGALWLPERNYNGNIEGVTIDAFLAQIANLKTIDYVQVALASPNIFSPVHTGPHPIIESLWQGDTDTNGDPINLVVPRASAPDPLLSWLKALDAAGLKAEVYVNSYNLLARKPASIPDDYPDLSARWENYCDTNPTVQFFIHNHPHLSPGDPERRKYMFCYAEFILKEYAIRYGDLIDAWCFDSADNIMEACGDDASSGILDDQRIYEAFADACHAGNPNAAIAFNNSVGTDAAPLATPTLFDDYAFGHPFGGAGNMVVPEILYTRNFAICEFMKTHNGLPFATTDSRDWNDNVVAHFFPKQSTTSWNAGAAPCLTDAQFVEWTAEGCINGGAITWGTPLVRTNLENSPVLTLQPYALTQLEAVDLHFKTAQYPGVPNWRRAETPLPQATIDVPYSHTLTDPTDFWDPAGGSITSLTMSGQPSWLSVAESSPGSRNWVMSGVPTETEAAEYSFDLQITAGTASSTRTVRLKVNESPIMPTTSRSIDGGAVWLDSGLELTYDNNGTANQNRAVRYSSQSFQSDRGFKLTASYNTDYIGYLGETNFSIGLVRVDTDLSNYGGLNPFGADASVYSLGLNLTTDLGASLRGLNFTNGSSVETLDTSGTNVQFVTGVSTPVAIEIDQDGAWSYSINGIVEASGVIPGGFDLSSSYRVVVYGQDDYGLGKSIQALALELLSNSPPVAGNIFATVDVNSSVGVTLDGSDPDDDNLTYSVLIAPEHGDLSGIAPNLTYTPDPDYAGLDTFTYKVNDGLADSEVATVQIEVKTQVGLIADWSLDDISSGVVADASGNDFHGTIVNGTAVSGVRDGAVDFNGSNSSVSLPVEAFATLSNEFTIAMWINGDAAQPSNDSVFQAFDGGGDRVLNIHLPYGNSTVFWDAGIGGPPYDRITKSATPYEFMGRWNHWVFTKNAASGEMGIYLNGSLWHSSFLQTGVNDKIKTMGGITQAFLGSGDGSAYYHGMIDEVKLYNVSLSEVEVSELYENYKGFGPWLSQFESLEDTGYASDSDHDGIDLLLEYILNGSPLQSDAGILPRMESTEGYFVFTFTRLVESADDTDQVFQYSTNLIDWTDLPITGATAPEVSIGSEIDGREEVTVTISKNLAVDGRLYGRLQAVSE